MTAVRLRAQAPGSIRPDQDAWGVLVALDVSGSLSALDAGIALVRGCGAAARLEVVLSARRRGSLRDGIAAAAVMTGAATPVPVCTAEAERIEQIVTRLGEQVTVPWSLWWTDDGLADAAINLAQRCHVAVTLVAPTRRRDRRSVVEARRILGAEVLVIDTSPPRRS